MKRSKLNALCCGAGGAHKCLKMLNQGNKEINIELMEDAYQETKPDIIAVGCPFCNTMLTFDGAKHQESSCLVKVMDIAVNCYLRSNMRL